MMRRETGAIGSARAEERPTSMQPAVAALPAHLMRYFKSSRVPSTARRVSARDPGARPPSLPLAMFPLMTLCCGLLDSDLTLVRRFGDAHHRPLPYFRPGGAS